MVEFHVLQCSQCETFQVLQVGKATKWKCKMCGQKQSILKVFGRGTGAECRRHVQKLNVLRGTLDQAAEESKLLKASQPKALTQGYDCFQAPEQVDAKNKLASCSQGPSVTKWSEYLEPCQEQKPLEVEDGAEEGRSWEEQEEWPQVTTDWTEYSSYRRQFRQDKKKWRHEPYVKKSHNNQECDHEGFRHGQNESSINRLVNPLSSNRGQDSSEVVKTYQCNPRETKKMTTISNVEPSRRNCTNNSALASTDSSAGFMTSFNAQRSNCSQVMANSRQQDNTPALQEKASCSNKTPPTLSKWAMFVEDNDSDDEAYDLDFS